MKKYNFLALFIFIQSQNNYLEIMPEIAGSTHLHQFNKQKKEPKTKEGDHNFSSFYTELDIPSYSSINTISKRFREISKTKHPDKANDNKDEYLKLSTIKNEISDPEKRFKFDINLIEEEIAFLEEKKESLKNELKNAYLESYEKGHGQKALAFFNKISFQTFELQKTDDAMNLKRYIDAYDEKVIEINKKIKINENKIKELKQKLEYFLSKKSISNSIDGLMGKWSSYKDQNRLRLYEIKHQQPKEDFTDLLDLD